MREGEMLGETEWITNASFLFLFQDMGMGSLPVDLSLLLRGTGDVGRPEKCDAR